VLDSGGAGRYRGAPGSEVMYGTKVNRMTVVVPSDGQHNPPRGVRGGRRGAAARTYKVYKDGRREQMPNVCQMELEPGEFVIGVDNGGGGYGDPLERDAARVLEDVLDGWVSRAAAFDIYGVAFTREIDDESLEIDVAATIVRRHELAAARTV